MYNFDFAPRPETGPFRAPASETIYCTYTFVVFPYENDHLMCIHISYIYIYTLYNYITTCTYCPNIIPKLRSCPPRLVAQIVSFRGSSASLRLPVTARRFVAERTSAWCCLRKSPERSTAPRQDCGEWSESYGYWSKINKSLWSI